MQTLLRMVVAGVVVGVVTLVAQRQPSIGGWVAAMPTVTLLSVLLLAAGGASNRDLVRFLVGVLAGLVPTILFIATMALSLRRGLPLPAALVLGAVAWISYTGFARLTGLFGL